MGVRKSHLIHAPTTTLHYIHISPFHISPPSYLISIHPTKTLLTRSPYFASQLSLHITSAAMASVNSSVLACNYAISGTGAPELNSKLVPMPSSAPAAAGLKMPVIRAQQARVSASKQSGASEGRRAALVYLAATLFTTAAATSSANAGVIEDYLEKSKANKELNDKKRLATTGANFARAYTVEFGTCKFPENFTGCQDLAKQKKVPFLSDDLALECEGKDKYKCGSNVFWKW